MSDQSETISSCFQALQKSVECAICLDILNDPIITRCQHHFCSICIQKAMKGRSSFPCPLCKNAITNRSLRPDAALSKMVVGIKDLISAGNEEIIGTEAALHVFSTTKKHTKENNSNSSTKNKRPGFRSLFPTPKHVKQKSSTKVHVEASADKSVKPADLLDIVDNMSKNAMLKTPPFGGSSTSTDSRNIPSVCLKKTKADKNEAEESKGGDENPSEDPFHFPITQTQPTTETKPSKKKPKKSSSSKKGQQEVRKSKRLQKPNANDPINKSPVDHKMIEDIQQTEQHSLTVEPVNANTDTTPHGKNRISSTSKSKQKTLSRKTPKKRLSEENIKRDSTKTDQKSDEAAKKVHSPVKDLKNDASCKEQLESPINQLNTNKDEESDNAIIKDHPKITRRLLSSDTSSSVNVTQDVLQDKPFTTDAVQLPDVAEKVSMWLKGIQPSDEMCFEPKAPEKQNSDEMQMMNLELEEFVSASQCQEELPKIVVKRKKRKLPADLISSEELSERKNTEFFNGQKAKRQYSATKKDTKSPMLNNLKSSLRPLETVNTVPAEAKSTLRRKTRKGKKETHIFDVPGLSQGVSPFTTPTKDPENSTKKNSENIAGENVELITGCSESDKPPTKSSNNEPHIMVKELETIASASPQNADDMRESSAKESIKNIQANEEIEPVKISSDNLLVEKLPKCSSKDHRNSQTERKPKESLAKTQESTPQGAINEAAKQDVSADVHREASLKSGQKCLNKSAPKPFSPTAKDTSNVQEKELQQTVVDLEDMPIICVRETQDSIPPYYVETPHCVNSSGLLHKNTDAKKTDQVKEPVKKRHEKTVELGLLDFSEPSQIVNQPSERTVVQSEKVLETCRMVLRNLDESKCEGNTADNPCFEEDMETNSITPGVGRVVDLARVEKPTETTKTMKDINMTLSEMDDHAKDEKSNTPKQDKKNKNKLDSECKSPVYSLYACPSSHDETSMHVSDCDTNVIQNTEEFNLQGKTMEIAKPIKRSAKRKRRSRLTMPAKKPRVRIVDAPKVAKPDGPKLVQSPLKITEMKATKHENETMDNISSDESVSTRMLCTSNGWGGTKLKIRILHGSKNKGRSSQSDSEMPEVGESKIKKSSMSQPTMNKDYAHISSSWPGTTRDVSVVLDKMDKSLLPDFARQKENSPDVNKPAAQIDDAEPDVQTEKETTQNVIPSSPLLFAPSQENKANQIDLTEDQQDINITSQKDVEDIEVVCQAWCENQENAPSCHESDHSPVKQIANNKEVPSHVESVKEKSYLLLENLNKFITKLNQPIDEATTDAWRNIFMLCKEIDVEINTKSSSATSSPDIKCVAKKSKRKLSMSSEEGNEPMQNENFTTALSNDNKSSTKGSQNEENNNSDVEIDSSLPTILPIIRNKHRPSINNSTTEVVNCPNIAVDNDLPKLITSTAKPVCLTEDVQDTNFTTGRTNLSQENDENQMTSPTGKGATAFGDISKIQKQPDPAKDSPESPDSHETSEFEDASVIAWTPKVEVDVATEMSNEQNAQPFVTSEVPTTIDDSQPEITTSQIPSPTPPPASTLSQPYFPDLTNVSELLQKISEFTEDLNKEQQEETDHNINLEVPTEQSLKEDQPDLDVTGPEINTSCKAKPLETTDKLEELPQPPVTEVRHILSPLNNSTISISTADTSNTSLDGSSRQIGLMTSGIKGKAAMIVRKFAKRCRGSFHETFVLGKVTHVIVKTDQLRCDRTLKFIQGIASKIWVVSYLWVVHSLKRKKILPEEEFEVIGDNIDTDDVASLHAPRRSRLSTPDYCLLKDYAVCCIPPFSLFTTEQLKEVLQLLGAKVLTKPNDFSVCDRKMKRILTLDANAYTQSLPNYPGIAETYSAEAVSCDWVFECVASFRIQPTQLFPVEETESQETAES
uniref:Breast cancer type 1 susceptibility protein homolog n=1 Tax=Phallusia mammillata TaxID=59560 RepID=A0A6F9D8J3_9ASCI|nr:breast cancer type 1 susceptibility protein homolog [Phallusia mammillata]